MSHRARAFKAHTSFKPKSKEESDEIVLLRAAHSKNLVLLNELFPSWSDEDLLYALQDTQGDLELAIARITEGFASQWGEVKNRKTKKEAPRSNHTPRAQSRNVDDKKVRGPNVKQPSDIKGKSPGSKDQNSQPATNGSQTGANPSDSKSTKHPVSATESADPSNNTRVPAKPLKTPVPQNTWASRVARGNPSISNTKDTYLRSHENKSHPISSSNDLTADLSNSPNNFPGLGGSSSSQSKANSQQITSSVPQAAKPAGSSWAKIASRAAQPKPAPVSNKSTISLPTEPETSEVTSTADNSNTPWAQDTTEASAQEQIIEPSIEVTTDEITQELDASSEQTIEEQKETIHIPETQEKPASAPRSPSPQSFYQIPESNVSLPSDMNAQMDELNKKFSGFGTNDILSMSLKNESTSETSGSQLQLGSIQNLASDSALSSKHSGISLGTPPGIASMRSSRTLTGNKSFVAAPSGINAEDNQGIPDSTLSANDVPPNSLDSKVEPSVETESEAPAQDILAEHLPISATEHRSSAQQPSHPQLNKAMSSNSQNQMPASQTMPQGYGQDFPQYYQPHQGMLQGMQHPHGAPGHLPHMHPQMMHPQNQGNYMPYYQYPYPPGPYNPYPGNNYTLQFAQKSLGGYDEPSQGGFNQSPGNPPNLQEQGSGNSHGYDKSSHGKHKGYDSNTGDSGTPTNPGAPMNYGNFGYGGMPNYQPPGGPSEAMYYHYYNQSGHPNMFNGYPSGHGPQHLPPHVQQQQQHQGYGSPLQQHQGHQASPQSQYPPSQPSPHHYTTHQQSNPNMRYQGWNN